MSPISVHHWNPNWEPTPSQQPAILRDAARHLFPGWSVDWLMETCPDAPVPVRTGETTTTLPLTMAVRLIGEARPKGSLGSDRLAPYITDWDFGDIAALRDHYCRPSFARQDPILSIPEERRPRLTWIYYGDSRSGTPLHQDVVGFHAWSVVVSGRKEWVFYPPDTDFGPDPIEHDVFAPGAEAADAQAGRKRMPVIVQTGDLIFVPSRWWHQVRNLAPTLAVGSNFVDSTIARLVFNECQRLDYPHIAHQLVQTYGSELVGST